MCLKFNSIRRGSHQVHLFLARRCVFDVLLKDKPAKSIAKFLVAHEPRSAIDNATRGLIGHGQLPVTCGLFFSLGHSTIVVIVV